MINKRTTNNAAHRTPIGNPVFVSLNVKAKGDFRWIDSFMIFIFHFPHPCDLREVMYLSLGTSQRFDVNMDPLNLRYRIPA